MKILIITSNVGRTAPGIVFERLIKGLSEIHEVDVLTANYEPSIPLDAVSNILVSKKSNIHPRISKFLIGFLNFSPFDWLWAFTSYKMIKNLKYDIVFSFISYHHYFPLFLGKLYKEKKQNLFFVYSVDAIPPPKGWIENENYREGVKKMLKSNLENLNVFFSANEKMLKYQIDDIIKPQREIVKEILYVPNMSSVMNEYEYINSDKYIFLFTGGIYGARKIEYLFSAFKKILRKYPTAELQFVGTKKNEKKLEIFTENERKNIFYDNYAADLIPYYKKAVALIDIDADIPNDVFLSSKIINYLTINRLIISETGDNSPSRHLFRKISSILQCSHNEDELYSAMEYAILSKNKVNFSDRNEVIRLFSIENSIQKIQSVVKKFGE